ncbi:UreD-domain-containing protein [Panaeolus papilionaceus]|nr:UreD-domain-containing protein [Panaeolus papilionaceus]
MDSAVDKIHSGTGRISLTLHGGKATLSELSSTYPLKLLSPYIQRHIAIVYLLTYGGGLVSGDHTEIDVAVADAATLVLLSQGTTKVFKTRPGQRLASVLPKPGIESQHAASSTQFQMASQRLHFRIHRESSLLLLPEPVTCFRNASYQQIQNFTIEGNGSLVLLDWITPGRISIGEEWAFSRYYSKNEIWHDGKCVAKDVQLLQASEESDDSTTLPQSTPSHHRIPQRTLQDRLRPYGCYAMVILYGPKVQPILADLEARYAQENVFKTRSPSELIWSLSHIGSLKAGGILRIAGLETDLVKQWLRGALSGIEMHMVGRDIYRRTFP